MVGCTQSNLVSLLCSEKLIRYSRAGNQLRENLCTLADDYLIDLGAQWVHGETNNVVYDIVAPMNLTDHSDPYVDEVYSSTGELIEPTIAKNLTRTFEQYLDSIADSTTNDCQQSVGECFENKYEFRIHALGIKKKLREIYP